MTTSASDSGTFLLLSTDMSGTKHTYPLPTLGTVVIGRGANCSFRIFDPSVSREHARLSAHEGLTVEDLGSSNGSYILRVPEVKLVPGEPETVFPGERVRLGDVVLRIESHCVRRVQSTATVRPIPRQPIPDQPPISLAMAAVYNLIERAAKSTLPVLISGETGVGKEMLASKVHELSQRAEGPLLKLNCAALSESLLESQMFGHERGAFTGANQAKTGMLEATNGGTVFLDEVGELPPSLQAKLLRVLEEGKVLRVGSNTPRSVDIRIVSATNRNLAEEVQQGRFRRDLFFRLNAVSVNVPSLRERRAEIMPLARHFIEAACRESGRSTPDISEEAAVVLLEHSWSGNVRELKNVVERALLMCDHGVIRPEHLHLQFSDEFSSIEPSTQTYSPIRVNARQVERQEIEQALITCGQNQTRAAKLLGISRRTLINRMEEFDMPRPRKGAP
ncbi:MAG: sigma 54-interacting transcriptional regulator [Polyangiaceae bacterium]|nr:sigma 54-interacting transcriptional regulator [Polyangiaceae bacterium]